jgi:hypothetical protein
MSKYVFYFLCIRRKCIETSIFFQWLNKKTGCIEGLGTYTHQRGDYNIRFSFCFIFPQRLGVGGVFSSGM